MLLEDAEDHPVDDQPAVLPEKRKEALHLIKWNDLREERHDPVLTQDKHFDLSVCQVSRQFRQLLLHEHFDHFAVLVETGQLAHVHLFKVIIVQQSDGQLEG